MIELKPGENPHDFHAGEEPKPMEATLEPERKTKPKNKPLLKGAAAPTVLHDVIEQDATVQGEPVTVPKAEEQRKEEPATTLPAAPPTPKVQVQLNSHGQAVTMDLDAMWRMVNILYKGKGFPHWVRTPEQAMAVAIYLKNLGLEIMTGIQHVCEVNGRLTLWGEGPLAAARASGKMKSIKEGFYTKDYEEICFKNRNLDADIHFAFCRTVRSDNGEVKETWFSEKDAATANKGLKEVWTGYRRTMFKRKARAENLKDNFGDVLQGAGISEYDDESAPDMPVNAIAPTSLADRVNQRMLPEKKDGEGEAPLQN